MGIYDRVVIQELIKTVASTDQLDHGSQRDFKVWILKENSYKKQNALNE